MRWFVAILSLLLAANAACGQVSTERRKAPEFTNSVEWLDPHVPHSLKAYRGKMVLIDFWEYTCINCIRDFAVVKRWYAKYHPYGLEVIGMHFGEFDIGQKTENVARAAKRFRLPWPVVADVHGAMWNAYHSDVWPNRYLIDQDGYIVMQVEGEGNNRPMEAKIRELLAKQHPEVARVALEPEESAFGPQCGYPTQETYVGDWYGRGALENPKGYGHGDTMDFKAGEPHSDGGVWLSGLWQTAHDGVTSEGRKNTGSLLYHARSVYAVMSVADPKKPVRVYLKQDGAPLQQGDAGADVHFDQQGAYVEVSEPRMYYLVKNAGDGLPLPKHTLMLSPQQTNFTLHSFTYGNNCQQEFPQL